jgi:hypothetical protein
MYDVFFGLCTMNIPRGHPVFMALLYSFCPAAAGWWINGVVPTPENLPYNAAWQVLSDYSEGLDLSTAFEKYGLDKEIIAPVKAYIDAIKKIRKHNSSRRAPELHYDNLANMDLSLRFGKQNAFANHFGGDWRNAFEYARVWVYVLTDWMYDICDRGEQEFTIKRKDIVFRLPKTNVSVQFPTFVWETKPGRFIQASIGFLAGGAVHNQFRSVMAMFSAPDKDHAWEAEPRVYALDPASGSVNYFEPVESPELLLADFAEVGEAVKEGSFPPMAAFVEPAKCDVCIFRSQCYGRKGELSEYVRRMIAPKKSLVRPMA